MSKNTLGQFYTTNYKYILSNMEIPNDVKHVIEPFVGNGDLLNFIKNKSQYNIEIYDVDPKIVKTVKRDTLLNPPTYTDKFILTNPPYLARNKNKNKELYDKYNCNDLYKCFITSIITNKCMGGIIIIPLNFLSSIRNADVELRRKFLTIYSIKIINIFEEQVFVDTSYSVCSMFFTQKQSCENNNIKLYIYPSNKEMMVILNKENNYTIGGEIYNIPQNSKYKVQRVTKYTLENVSNILLKCIDDDINSQLGFKFVDDEDKFIDNTPKLSARSYASLVIIPNITLTQQKELVDEMNYFIKQKREEYNSLFLANYRESNTIARKRISFNLAFKICNYMLSY
jgi:type I restriction-modification system DNA methylase subunit